MHQAVTVARHEQLVEQLRADCHALTSRITELRQRQSRQSQIEVLLRTLESVVCSCARRARFDPRKSLLLLRRPLLAAVHSEETPLLFSQASKVNAARADAAPEFRTGFENGQDSLRELYRLVSVLKSHGPCSSACWNC